MVKIDLEEAALLIKSDLEEVALLIESINGKRILKGGTMILPLVDDNTPREELDIVKNHIQEENRLMTLNPLGHKPIKDIDEIHQRNRRKSDDPYIKATSEKMAYRFPKIDDTERR